MVLHTAEEVAALFQINPTRLKRLANKHKWPFHKLGNSIRFSDQDIAEIEQLTRNTQLPVKTNTFGRS